MAQNTQPIVILISGAGSNMQAIVRRCAQDHWAERFGARVAAVISNRADAGGLAWAQGAGIATKTIDHREFSQRAQFEAALRAAIEGYALSSDRAALVALAGFMRILTAPFVEHFKGRLINIHPSLLPAFTGLHTHQRALDEGCWFAGATVHEVTAELDHGPILAQAVVPILPGDDARTLGDRVLTQEHLIYPRAIEQWLARRAP